MKIEIVLAYRHPQDIRALFSEYTNMLIINDSSFQNYLDIQHYDNELNHLKSFINDLPMAPALLAKSNPLSNVSTT